MLYAKIPPSIVYSTVCKTCSLLFLPNLSTTIPGCIIFHIPRFVFPSICHLISSPSSQFQSNDLPDSRGYSKGSLAYKKQELRNFWGKLWLSAGHGSLIHTLRRAFFSGTHSHPLCSRHLFVMKYKKVRSSDQILAYTKIYASEI